MVVALAKRERSVVPLGHRRLEGRPCSREAPPRRGAVALLSLSALARRRGAHLSIFCARLAREFDVELFAFTDGEVEAGPVLEFCARVVLVQKPRYREPRWSTLLPPEVHEFRSPAMRQALDDERRAFRFELLQVEYTQLAEYGGDVLVEHDVTFDLFGQIAPPRPLAGRMVGLRSAGAASNAARSAAVPARRRHVEEGRGTCSAPP